MRRPTRTPNARALVIAVIAGALALPGPAGAAPDFETLLSDRPYVRLFTEAMNCDQVRGINSLEGPALSEKLDKLVRWYGHFNSQESNELRLGNACRGESPTTLATKLVARAAVVSNYRNGSYTSQARLGERNFDEARLLEEYQPLSIGTFWPGDFRPYRRDHPGSGRSRLADTINANDQTIIVTPAVYDQVTGAPTTWPFVNSRGTGLLAGARSENSHDFVSWIRVGDEMMQVVAEPILTPARQIALTVRRRAFGTTAVRHGKGGRVLAPVYIGSSAAVSADQQYAGSPARDDPAYPLRYGIKIWQAGGAGWIANRIDSTFGAALQGYNALWLDTSSCDLYNTASANSTPVAAWDDPLATKMTRERWAGHQKTKFAGLRQAFPGAKIVANNLGNGNPCTDDLLANHVDWGGLEGWLKQDAKHPLDWHASMNRAITIMSRNWPAIFWVRWNYDFTGWEARYRRFSYGSMLLAHRATANRPLYGGPWGLDKPDELYFWNWGAPSSTPTSVEQLKVPNRDLYRRAFANGIVLVNPTSRSITQSLGGVYYDVLDKEGGTPRAVTSVTVPPRDAAFLLRG